jgi:hypothetical protein
VLGNVWSVAGADFTEKLDVTDWNDDTRRSRTRDGGVKFCEVRIMDRLATSCEDCTGAEYRWLDLVFLCCICPGCGVGRPCGGSAE